MNQLRPPPRSPNCVSSQAEPSDRIHWIAPLPLHGDRATAIDRLAAIIGQLPRTSLVERGGAYARFTFTTRLVRYVDDVELLVHPTEPRVDVRSASRVGWGDLGTNRRRVEALRAAWIRADLGSSTAR